MSKYFHHFGPPPQRVPVGHCAVPPFGAGCGSREGLGTKWRLALRACHRASSHKVRGRWSPTASRCQQNSLLPGEEPPKQVIHGKGNYQLHNKRAPWAVKGIQTYLPFKKKQLGIVDSLRKSARPGQRKVCK